MRYERVRERDMREGERDMREGERIYERKREI